MPIFMYFTENLLNHDLEKSNCVCSRCCICKKIDDLKTVSPTAIVDFFLKKNIILIHGSVVCQSHLFRGKLRDELSDPPLESVEMSEEQITNFLSHLRIVVNDQLNQKKGEQFLSKSS